METHDHLFGHGGSYPQRHMSGKFTVFHVFGSVEPY